MSGRKSDWGCTFGHGVQLRGHCHGDALGGLTVPETARELENELAICILVRGVLVVQLFEGLKLCVQVGEVLDALVLQSLYF